MRCVLQQGLAGWIRVNSNHNHSTSNAAALSLLPSPAHLRSTFEGLDLCIHLFVHIHFRLVLVHLQWTATNSFPVYSSAHNAALV